MLKNSKKRIIIVIIIGLCIVLSYLTIERLEVSNDIIENSSTNSIFDLNNIPPYSGNAYIELNGNIPKFEESDYTTDVFEKYSKLDEYNRCGVAFANICSDTMPTEKRGTISYEPTGWVQNDYPNLINTTQLYNRCHLIAWQLSAENNNKENLMTGTAYLNQAMIKWEDLVAEYIKENKEKNYHVLYRVTPIFEGNNLLASGVNIEAMSVEERMNGIYFNIYIYNVQPKIYIDYSTGYNYEI